MKEMDLKCIERDCDIYTTLNAKGEMNVHEIVEATGHSYTNVRNSIYRMTHQGIIGRKIRLADCRNVKYFIRQEAKDYIDTAIQECVPC